MNENDNDNDNVVILMLILIVILFTMCFGAYKLGKLEAQVDSNTRMIDNIENVQKLKLTKF